MPATDRLTHHYHKLADKQASERRLTFRRYTYVLEGGSTSYSYCPACGFPQPAAMFKDGELSCAKHPLVTLRGRRGGAGTSSGS